MNRTAELHLKNALRALHEMDPILEHLSGYPGEREERNAIVKIAECLENSAQLMRAAAGELGE